MASSLLEVRDTLVPLIPFPCPSTFLGVVLSVPLLVDNVSQKTSCDEVNRGVQAVVIHVEIDDFFTNVYSAIFCQFVLVILFE